VVSAGDLKRRKGGASEGFGKLRSKNVERQGGEGKRG